MIKNPNTQALKVAVLQGGASAEREVSLASGKNCIAALETAGFKVCAYDTAELSFMDALLQNPPDVAFIALHGKGGEDGTVQGVLELLGIPYTGSGVLASALAMDKTAAKSVFHRVGLPTPDDVMLTRAEVCGAAFDMDALCEKLVARLGESLVVKPNNEGSSVGVSIVHDCDDLPDALHEALEFDDCVLVEPYIPGHEIMAGVLEECVHDRSDAAPEIVVKALPLIEVESASEFYDYHSKYASGGSRHILPAHLDEEQTRVCQELAVAAHKVLGCKGYSRSDIRLRPDGKAFLLETNTLPGMTKTSLIPEAARSIGIELPELVTRLIHIALQ